MSRQLVLFLLQAKAMLFGKSWIVHLDLIPCAVYVFT